LNRSHSGNARVPFGARAFAVSSGSRRCWSIRRHIEALVLGMLVLFAPILTPGCRSPMSAQATPKPRRDINAVLADHDQELLAMSGVVGVYVGLLPDGKTPCLTVMLAHEDPELKRTLPRQIEGCAVRVEVTGPIRPLGESGQQAH
jgi:hypothetical protein